MKVSRAHAPQPVSIALDVDDTSPFDVPGTTTRAAAGGLAARNLIAALDLDKADLRLPAAELVEIAPRLDTRADAN